MLLVYLLHLASGACNCTPVGVHVYDVYSILALVRARAQGQSLVLCADSCVHHTFDYGCRVAQTVLHCNVLSAQSESSAVHCLTLCIVDSKNPYSGLFPAS